MARFKQVPQKYLLGKLVTESRIAAYAARYETSACGISIVLENVKRLAPKASKVDELVARLMKPHCQLMGVRKESGFLPARGYSLEGLNIKSKVGLDQIVVAVRNYYDANDCGYAL